MIFRWHPTAFRRLSDFDNNTILLIRSNFEQDISIFPRRYPLKSYKGLSVRIYYVPKLPFKVIYQVDKFTRYCDVYLVVHDRQLVMFD